MTDVSDRNNISRHFENREYETTKAKGYTILNETGIQDPDKKANTEGSANPWSGRPAAAC